MKKIMIVIAAAVAVIVVLRSPGSDGSSDSGVVSNIPEWDAEAFAEDPEGHLEFAERTLAQKSRELSRYSRDLEDYREKFAGSSHPNRDAIVAAIDNSVSLIRSQVQMTETFLQMLRENREAAKDPAIMKQIHGHLREVDGTVYRLLGILESLEEEAAGL